MSAQRLRDLIVADDLLVLPGTFDGLTAAIVESIGFDAVYLGGYATGASTAHTEPVLSMTEMRDRAQSIVENVDVPVLVDGNAGFGNAPHTYRSIRAYAQAGIAGIHIEDQVYPKRLHYHAGRKHITPASEMESKITAATQSIEECGDDIVLIARTDAARGQRRSEHDETIEDAVHRANAYLDAGAEAAMVFPQSTAELAFAVEHIDGPVVFTLVEGRDPVPPIAELDDLGVAAVLYALSATIQTAKSVQELYTGLLHEGVTALEKDDFDRYQTLVEECIGLPRYYDLEASEGKK